MTQSEPDADKDSAAVEQVVVPQADNGFTRSLCYHALGSAPLASDCRLVTEGQVLARPDADRLGIQPCQHCFPTDMESTYEQ